MRRYLIRLLIFGVIGPAATYAGVYLTVRTAEQWWWPQPSVYWVELTPFLLCAFFDSASKTLSVLERLIATGVAAFVASALACALAYGGLGSWVFGLYTSIIAAACSLFAAGTDIDEGDFISD